MSFITREALTWRNGKSGCQVVEGGESGEQGGNHEQRECANRRQAQQVDLYVLDTHAWGIIGKARALLKESISITI